MTTDTFDQHQIELTRVDSTTVDQISSILRQIGYGDEVHVPTEEIVRDVLAAAALLQYGG